MSLPEDWLGMLDEGKLTLEMDPALFDQFRRAIMLWFQSSPGRDLLQLCGLDLKVLSEQNAGRVIISKGIPVPAEELLFCLEHRSDDIGGLQHVSASADDLLQLLGAEFTELSSPKKFLQLDKTRPDHHVRSTRALEHELAEEVFVDGIPLFPEHYLYDFYRPVLQRYCWTDPLQLESSFFDHFKLCDTSGTCYEITGEMIARGLWLTSRTGLSETEFPVDPQIAETILQRYLSDLRSRRQALIQLAHRRTTDQKTADRLVRRVWGQKGLPPWEAVEAADPLFSGGFQVK
jgi:hypothetical protein